MSIKSTSSSRSGLSNLESSSISAVPVVSKKDIPQYNPHFDLVCGYMRKKYNDKRGGGTSTWSNLSWTRRWFWVAIDIPDRGNYVLSYSSQEAKINLKPKRSFHLVGTKIIIHNSRTFSLQFPNQLLSLRCDSDQEAFRWTSSLTHIIAVADLRAEVLSSMKHHAESSLSTHFLQDDDNDTANASLNTNVQSYASTSESDNTRTADGERQYSRSVALAPFNSSESTSAGLQVDNKNDETTVSPWKDLPGTTAESPLRRKSRSHSISVEVSSPFARPDLVRRYQEKRDAVVLRESPRNSFSTPSSIMSYVGDSLFYNIYRGCVNFLNRFTFDSKQISKQITAIGLCLAAFCVCFVFFTFLLSVSLAWCNGLVYSVLFIWNFVRG